MPMIDANVKTEVTLMVGERAFVADRLRVWESSSPQIVFFEGEWNPDKQESCLTFSIDMPRSAFIDLCAQTLRQAGWTIDDPKPVPKPGSFEKRFGVPWRNPGDE